jgi:hypothetical protein
MPSEFIIGRSFGARIANVEMRDVTDYNDMLLAWGDYSEDHICWLTKPSASELQLAYMAVSRFTCLRVLESC